MSCISPMNTGKNVRMLGSKCNAKIKINHLEIKGHMVKNEQATTKRKSVNPFHRDLDRERAIKQIKVRDQSHWQFCCIVQL